MSPRTTPTGRLLGDQQLLHHLHDPGPAHALATGIDGGNGVYLYGASGFPNSTYQATNYWVDVVFGTSAATRGADRRAAGTRPQGRPAPGSVASRRPSPRPSSPAASPCP